MNLKDIAAVTGKSGLFRIVKPTRTGVILETLDDQKKKVIANSASKVSVLKEISIYTNTTEGSQPLEEVFNTIYQKYGKDLPVKPKDSKEDLYGFLEEFLPEYDEDSVYHSDIKKLVSWYNILMEQEPELFEQASEDEESADTSSEDSKKESGASSEEAQEEGEEKTTG